MSDGNDAVLEGRLLAVTNEAPVDGVEVWFAFTTVGGHQGRLTTISDGDGIVEFALPTDAIVHAMVGAAIEGVAPLDLEPGGQRMEAGEFVLIVDEIVPAHLRTAG